MSQTFGVKIEMLQAEKGISLSTLSTLAGMSRQTLYRVKKSKKPHMLTVHRLAKAFKVPVSYFFDKK
ncbi:MAG TPA: helix-turn-helix transcriptional regulator [Desulfatiglandales bacterium]|nr:helix-turn-helix transcriptional regulator [Desulfatiglandales bacterium]